MSDYPEGLEPHEVDEIERMTAEAQAEASRVQAEVQALPDSGHRVNFATGAHREMAPGKGRYDLISPIATDLLAKLLEKGAVKYTKYEEDGVTVKETGERNWEKGLPLHCFVDSAARHLNQLLAGNTDEDHMVAVMWNAMAFIHTREMIARGELPGGLDDLPLPHYYQGVK